MDSTSYRYYVDAVITAEDGFQYVYRRRTFRYKIFTYIYRVWLLLHRPKHLSGLYKVGPVEEFYIA